MRGVQQDSIAYEGGAPTGLDSAAHVPSRPLSPYHAIRLLPSDATPAQQDSIVQAWFKPKEIDYGNRPDTFHLPGMPAGESIYKTEQLQYEHEYLLTYDSVPPQMNDGQYGVAGAPVPYLLRTDNVMTLLLLFCFVLFSIAVAHSTRFVTRQLKDFFFIPRNDEGITETSGELRFQLFLVLLNSLLLAISAFMLATQDVRDTFVLDNDLHLVAIFFSMFLAYYLLKAILHLMVDATFFDGKKCLQLQKIQLFLTAIVGALLFPAVLLQVYFELSVESVTYYIAIVLIITKILTFYKSWAIFFRQKGGVLQNILYFCALEITPLLAIGGALVLVVKLLKVNF